MYYIKPLEEVRRFFVKALDDADPRFTKELENFFPRWKLKPVITFLNVTYAHIQHIILNNKAVHLCCLSNLS